MLKVGSGRDLLDKAFAAEYGGKLRTQHLHGHLPLVLQIFGEIDSGHAALAKVAFDLVAVREGSRESGGHLGHGGVRWGQGRAMASEAEAYSWRNAVTGSTVVAR